MCAKKQYGSIPFVVSSQIVTSASIFVNVKKELVIIPGKITAVSDIVWVDYFLCACVYIL